MVQISWDTIILVILVLIIFSIIIANLWLQFINVLAFDVFCLNPQSAWHCLILALAVTIILFAGIYLFNREVSPDPVEVTEDDLIDFTKESEKRDFDWKIEKIVVPVKPRTVRFRQPNKQGQRLNSRKAGINSLLDVTDYSH